MFRFFRRIRQRLLSENRFSRYIIYAVGEVFLVVIGILIALAANNWNTERVNANLEVKLLRQLQEEFSENLTELERNIELRENMSSSAYTLRDCFINGAEGMSLDSLEKHRALTYYDVNFNAPNGVVSLLLSSGELNLIKDDELRNRLSNWSGTLKEMTDQEDFVTNHLLSQYFNYTNLNFDAIRLAGVYDQMKDEAFTDPLKNKGEVSGDEEDSTVYSIQDEEFKEWTKWLSDKTIINYVLQMATRNKLANEKAREVKMETMRILELIRLNLQG